MILHHIYPSFFFAFQVTEDADKELQAAKDGCAKVLEILDGRKE